MAFKFSLQQVLDYREQLEDQAKVRFAKAQSDFLEAQRYLEELQTLLDEQQAVLCNPESLGSMERWLAEQYAKGLREDITYSSRRLIELDKIVREARSHLVLKAKERKVLDKLKEKQSQRYKQNELIQEQRSYDETASLRFKVTTF